MRTIRYLDGLTNIYLSDSDLSQHALNELAQNLSQDALQVALNELSATEDAAASIDDDAAHFRPTALHCSGDGSTEKDNSSLRLLYSLKDDNDSGATSTRLSLSQYPLGESSLAANTTAAGQSTRSLSQYPLTDLSTGPTNKSSSLSADRECSSDMAMCRTRPGTVMERPETDGHNDQDEFAPPIIKPAQSGQHLTVKTTAAADLTRSTVFDNSIKFQHGMQSLNIGDSLLYTEKVPVTSSTPAVVTVRQSTQPSISEPTFLPLKSDTSHMLSKQEWSLSKVPVAEYVSADDRAKLLGSGHDLNKLVTGDNDGLEKSSNGDSRPSLDLPPRLSLEKTDETLQYADARPVQGTELMHTEDRIVSLEHISESRSNRSSGSLEQFTFDPSTDTSIWSSTRTSVDNNVVMAAVADRCGSAASYQSKTSGNMADNQQLATNSSHASVTADASWSQFQQAVLDMRGPSPKDVLRQLVPSAGNMPLINLTRENASLDLYSGKASGQKGFDSLASSTSSGVHQQSGTDSMLMYDGRDRMSHGSDGSDERQSVKSTGSSVDLAMTSSKLFTEENSSGGQRPSERGTKEFVGFQALVPTDLSNNTMEVSDRDSQVTSNQSSLHRLSTGSNQQDDIDLIPVKPTTAEKERFERDQAQWTSSFDHLLQPSSKPGDDKAALTTSSHRLEEQSSLAFIKSSHSSSGSQEFVREYAATFSNVLEMPSLSGSESSTLRTSSKESLLATLSNRPVDSQSTDHPKTQEIEQPKLTTAPMPSVPSDINSQPLFDIVRPINVLQQPLSSNYLPPTSGQQSLAVAAAAATEALDRCETLSDRVAQILANSDSPQSDSSKPMVHDYDAGSDVDSDVERITGEYRAILQGVSAKLTGSNADSVDNIWKMTDEAVKGVSETDIVIDVTPATNKQPGLTTTLYSSSGLPQMFVEPSSGSDTEDALDRDVKRILAKYGRHLSSDDEASQPPPLLPKGRLSPAGSAEDTDDTLSHRVQTLLLKSADLGSTQGTSVISHSLPAYMYDDPSHSMTLPVDLVSTTSSLDTLPTSEQQLLPARPPAAAGTVLSSITAISPANSNSHRSESKATSIDSLHRKVSEILTTSAHLDDSSPLSAESRTTSRASSVDYRALQHDLMELENNLETLKGDGDDKQFSSPSSYAQTSYVTPATSTVTSEYSTPKKYTWDHGADIGVNDEGLFICAQEMPRHLPKEPRRGPEVRRSPPKVYYSSIPLSPLLTHGVVPMNVALDILHGPENMDQSQGMLTAMNESRASKDTSGVMTRDSSMSKNDQSKAKSISGIMKSDCNMSNRESGILKRDSSLLKPGSSPSRKDSTVDQSEYSPARRQLDFERRRDGRTTTDASWSRRLSPPPHPSRHQDIVREHIYADENRDDYQHSSYRPSDVQQTEQPRHLTDSYSTRGVDDLSRPLATERNIPATRVLERKDEPYTEAPSTRGYQQSHSYTMEQYPMEQGSELDNYALDSAEDEEVHSLENGLGSDPPSSQTDSLVDRVSRLVNHDSLSKDAYLFSKDPNITDYADKPVSAINDTARVPTFGLTRLTTVDTPDDLHDSPVAVDSFNLTPITRHPFSAFGNMQNLFASQRDKASAAQFDESVELRSPVKKQLENVTYPHEDHLDDTPSESEPSLTLTTDQLIEKYTGRSPHQNSKVQVEEHSVLRHQPVETIKEPALQQKMETETPARDRLMDILR